MGIEPIRSKEAIKTEVGYPRGHHPFYIFFHLGKLNKKVVLTTGNFRVNPLEIVMKFISYVTSF
jgi:hypothetical protein